MRTTILVIGALAGILLPALNAGCYQYPRRISATELAEKLGYSKSTLIEYLRKAENTIITTVCAPIP